MEEKEIRELVAVEEGVVGCSLLWLGGPRWRGSGVLIGTVGLGGKTRRHRGLTQECFALYFGEVLRLVLRSCPQWLGTQEMSAKVCA